MRLFPLWLAVLLGCGAAPSEPVGAGADLAVEFLGAQPAGSVIRLSASVENVSGRDLQLQNHCTPLKVDQDDTGSWRRIEPLRLCAGPSLVRIATQTTLTIDDELDLRPGRYRVLVATTEGHEFFSTPFDLR